MSLVRSRWRLALLIALLQLIFLALKTPSAHAQVIPQVLPLEPSPSAQGLELTAPQSAADPAVGTAMRDLAGRVLPVYEDQDPVRYLANLSALQLVVGDFQAADETRRSLRERHRDEPEPFDGRARLFDLYAEAKAAEARDGVSFADGFTRAFNETVPKLDDRQAYAVTAWLGTPLAAFEGELQTRLDASRDRETLTEAEAIPLVWSYLAYEAARALGDLLATLAAPDDQRRYAIEEDVAIAGGKIRARVVRPKDATKLPALLEFTIRPDGHQARAFAAHGYAGIVAGTRMINKKPVPFDHDGEDARAVIAWIAKQPWSDGRVAMVGDRYGGFAAWAAAKRPPRALTAIATLDAMAPGIDFPAEGRIFRSSSYRWAETHVEAKPKDDARWRELEEAWYRSGKPYRDFGKDDRVFQNWLVHPSYDPYWRKLAPSRDELARLAIPVLAVAGTEGSAEVGTLFTFDEHRSAGKGRHRANADHTLVLAARDDRAMPDVDLRELRFGWLDHVLRGAERPALLKDRVNHLVAGADEWRHAPSIEAMANGSLRLHLDTGGGEPHRLAPEKPAEAPPLALTVDFADRADAGAEAAADARVPHPHGAMFLSEPLPDAIEVAGVLSGHLDFEINKRDVDLYVALYEQRPGGEHVRLFDPYAFRVSYAKDRTRRQLLTAGKRRQLAFRSEQMMSRRLEQGSRLVLVLGIVKRPDRELNHGSGKAVTEESAADGEVPLELAWFADSYVEVPVRR